MTCITSFLVHHLIQTPIYPRDCRIYGRALRDSAKGTRQRSVVNMWTKEASIITLDSQDKPASCPLTHTFHNHILLIGLCMGGEHEMGHLSLTTVLLAKPSGMGNGNMALKASDRTSNGFPDEPWKPKSLPEGKFKSGWPESNQRLRDDPSCFLKESAGNVKVALAISIYCKMPGIVIDK